MDHHHQPAGVAGQFSPHGSSHDLRQGGAQAAYGGVHDVPGWARGYVLVHTLPVHPGLHYTPHYHQHLLLTYPVPRLQLHPPCQAEAVSLGEKSHQDGPNGYWYVPDLLVTLPHHSGAQHGQQQPDNLLYLRLQHQYLSQLLTQLHQPTHVAHFCPELP